MQRLEQGDAFRRPGGTGMGCRARFPAMNGRTISSGACGTKAWAGRTECNGGALAEVSGLQRPGTAALRMVAAQPCPPPGENVKIRPRGFQPFRLYRFGKFCGRIFKRWWRPKAALKPPQSKRCATAERPPRATHLERRIVIAARSYRVGGRRPRGRWNAGANIKITKRTQMNLPYKCLNMRALIRKLRFSKRAKRTQTNPNQARLCRIEPDHPDSDAHRGVATGIGTPADFAGGFQLASNLLRCA